MIPQIYQIYLLFSNVDSKNLAKKMQDSIDVKIILM